MIQQFFSSHIIYAYSSCPCARNLVSYNSPTFHGIYKTLNTISFRFITKNPIQHFVISHSINIGSPVLSVTLFCFVLIVFSVTS